MRNGIQELSTPAAAPPGGHYSQAIAHGDMLFLSGQLPIRPDGRIAAGEPFEAQARVALDNLTAILAESGLGPSHVVRVTAYLAGVSNWAAFDAIYAEVFGGAKPARSVVPVPALHHGCLIEIEAIAVRCQSEGCPA